MKLFETKIEIREDFPKPDKSEYRIVRSRYLLGIRISLRYLDLKALEESGRVDWDRVELCKDLNYRYVIKSIEDCMPYIELLNTTNKKPIYHGILSLEN